MVNRRRFLLAGLGVMASATSGLSQAKSAALSQAKVVVIGGGAGGANACRTLKELAPEISVTLIEPKRHYHTCFMSNAVISQLRTLSSIVFDYAGLAQLGVQVVHDYAVGIDPVKQRVTTQEGLILGYDRLIVSPGVEFIWNSIEGYDESATSIMPHAWSAGEQTQRLTDQLHTMRNGGTFIIAVPPNPFRCPPGPYERASLVAEYFKKFKPKSKVLLLDAKDTFTKESLFIEGWKQLYRYGQPDSMIEWRPQKHDGKVVRVNKASKTVYTELEEISADVINIIPPQRAGKVAQIAGLTDESGWCPVDTLSFESRNHANIYVIGDACIAGPMPKSGFSASSQAKVCAAAVIDSLHGREPLNPGFINTCYSLVASDYGISIAAVYRHIEEKGLYKVAGAGGVSPLEASANFRAREAGYAYSWYENMTHDMFNTAYSG